MAGAPHLFYSCFGDDDEQPLTVNSIIASNQLLRSLGGDQREVAAPS